MNVGSRRLIVMVALVAFLGSMLGVRANTAGASTPAQNSAYVTRVFSDFLGRAPTSAELTYWSGAVAPGVSARYALVVQLASSNEWISHIVTGFYTDTLGRPADATGLSYWDQVIASKQATVAQVAAQFYASNEYFAGFGQADTQSWITDLYRKLLHREPDAAGLQYWTGVTGAAGRGAVAYGFYQSTESAGDRVSSLFVQLLHRFPDLSGQAYWTGRVVTDGDLALAANLASSDEYFAGAQHSWPLTILTLTLPNASTERPYLAELIATGGRGPYRWTATGLPAGLGMEQRGVITGSPQGPSNAYVATITVTDQDGLTTTSVINAMVNSSQNKTDGPMQITTRVLPEGYVGQPYSASFDSMGGGFGFPLWSATGLPPGVVMGLVGSPETSTPLADLAGTPTAAGVYAPWVTVTGPDGSVDRRQFLVAVSAQPPSPNRVRITTPSLPAAQLNKPYSATLTAAGGSGGYHWVATNLPVGLTLDSSGHLTGTPTSLGGYEPMIAVADSNASLAAEPRALVVRETPPATQHLTNVTKVAIGGATCAIANLGSLYCWGAYLPDNWQPGQAFAIATTPRQIPGLTGVTDVVTGSQDECAVALGNVYCWGTDQAGWSGTGTVSPSITPRQVQGIAGVDHLVFADSDVCAETVLRTIYCWGQNNEIISDGTTNRLTTPQLIPGLTGVTAMSGTGSSACALDGTGAAYCWGYNANGQLGNGTTSTDPVFTPVRVQGLTNVTSISSSGANVCAVSDGGRTSCWGANQDGVLGNGTTTDASTPQVVTGLPAAKSVSINGLVACAITAAGQLYCWGEDVGGTVMGQVSGGQLLTPALVGGLDNVTDVRLDNPYCAIANGGLMYCWGYNSQGQIGGGTGPALFGSDAYVLQPLRVVGLTNVTFPRNLGFATPCAIASGIAYCWSAQTGSDPAGDLASPYNPRTPLPVAAPS